MNRNHSSVSSAGESSAGESESDECEGAEVSDEFEEAAENVEDVAEIKSGLFF